MDKPLVFFVLVGVVLMLAFYYGGVSFFPSGPLATGPGGSSVSAPAPSAIPASSGGGTAPSVAPVPAGISPFRGEVTIVSVASWESDVHREHLTLARGSSLRIGDQPLSLSGWTLENAHGERVSLPGASLIPFVSDAPAAVTLLPGTEAIVTTGSSDFGVSFRENICTGYFNAQYVFVPALTEACPTFSVDDAFRNGLNSACASVITDTYQCRQPVFGYEQSAAGNDCIAFANAHMNYSGCVADNRGAKNFLTGVWRLFLNRNEKLWDSRHDRITLRDADGRVVDEYTY